MNFYEVKQKYVLENTEKNKKKNKHWIYITGNNERIILYVDCSLYLSLGFETLASVMVTSWEHRSTFCLKSSQ